MGLYGTTDALRRQIGSDLGVSPQKTYVYETEGFRIPEVRLYRSVI